MSKHKNVYPDHYKTGGSARQGESVVQSDHKEKLARERAEREDNERKGDDIDEA